MKIAFYAPMKPPSDPVPSGDRRMARLLIQALELAGHEVQIASRLRSRDGAGDRAVQEQIRARALASARRLIPYYKANPADAWLTYHVYHKAPDWLGPAISKVLRIPYVICEASYAPKRSGGPWEMGHLQTEMAIGRADAVIGLNSNDAACVRPLLKPGAQMIAMRPFLDATAFSGPRTSRTGPPLLLAVGMMRAGDKLASYRILAAALSRVRDLDWQLLVVGDGPARDEVKAVLRPLGRVKFAGEVAASRMPEIYAAADLYVWPAVREAYGMALLEAQAAGCAAVAGNVGGVGDIVRHGETGLLAADDDPADFAACVRTLLLDPQRRAAMGARARELVIEEHSLTAASAVLDRTIRDACKVSA